MAESIYEEEVVKNLEREAITALIMSDKAIAYSRPYIELDMFSNFMSKTIAQWCLDFFDDFKKSPKMHIKDLFMTKKSSVDDSTSELIDMFLVSLSDTFASLESYNEDYATSRLIDFMNNAISMNLIESIGNSLDHANYEQVAETAANFRLIRRALDAPNCKYDKLLFEARDEDSESFLFEYPGALGKLLGPVSRSSFSVILATEKRGKSQYLLYFAKLAAKKKRNVLFITAGDMTLKEISERERLSATGLNQKLKEAMTVYKPVLDCKQCQSGGCMEHDFEPINEKNLATKIPEELLGLYPDHVPCTECRKNDKKVKDFKPSVWWEEVEMLPVSAEVVDNVLNDYIKTFNRQCGKRGDIEFIFFPTKTCRPEDIEEILRRKKEDGNPVDVLVVDYMDILDAPARARKMDDRNKINATWEEMRRISQVYDLALLTATQGNRSMYDSDADQSSTSEDKRKAAHVTCMYALNQKSFEKDQGIMRFSLLFKRDGDCSLSQEAKVLYSFQLGKPYIASYLSRKQNPESYKKDSGKKSIKKI